MWHVQRSWENMRQNFLNQHCTVFIKIYEKKIFHSNIFCHFTKFLENDITSRLHTWKIDIFLVPKNFTWSKSSPPLLRNRCFHQANHEIFATLLTFWLFAPNKNQRPWQTAWPHVTNLDSRLQDGYIPSCFKITPSIFFVSIFCQCFFCVLLPCHHWSDYKIMRYIIWKGCSSVVTI